MLLNKGVSPKGLGYDVLLASYVKDPNRKHTIEAQALDFLNHIISSPDDIQKFACDEAQTVLKLYDYWKENLDEAEKKVGFYRAMPVRGTAVNSNP